MIRIYTITSLVRVLPRPRHIRKNSTESANSNAPANNNDKCKIIFLLLEKVKILLNLL